ncbi:MAG TPA: Gfo/Idh/MocA family oxidoreductase [Nitrospira sp.]|nr:Gfo/Idh/MocA family oxidoreductase [Nitrospira sp.]
MKMVSQEERLRTLKASSNLRVGLLGAGGIATTHAMMLKSLPGIELVGVADIDKEKARRLAERFGAGGWYSSLLEMIAGARPDVVHILLPPDLHARLAIEAMAAGADVFVEKPLCVSEDECRAIEKAAYQFGRLVGVNHNVTFEPTFLRLIEVIRSRRIGRVQHVAVYWSVPFGDNTFDAPLFMRHGAGAVMLETGPHPLSLLVRLVGEVRSAVALVTEELRAAPDTWQLAFACERGTGQCFIGVGRPFTETRVRVVGEDGVAEADLRLGNVTVTENTRSSPLFFKLTDTLALSRSLASSAARGFAGLVRRIPGGAATNDFWPMMRGSIGAFYEALRKGEEPKVSLREGLAVTRSCLRAIEAAHVSMNRNGSPAGAREEATWQSQTAFL